MKGEIDRDFYCLIDTFVKTGAADHCKFYGCGVDTHGICTKSRCGYCYRKWPTPEQYKEEYGGEYPEDGAVYMRQVDIDDPSHTGGWHSPCFGYRDARSQSYACSIIEIICACTPWGKPPDNWRPE